MSVDAVTPAYEISQEALDLRDMVRRLAQDKIAPRAGDIDRKSEYPWDVRELLASHDILGLPFDAEYGGTGHRDAGPADGGRGDRQGLRLLGADADGAGAGDAADPALRLRGAEAALAAEVRQRRVVAGLRALGARGRLGPGGDADQRRPRRRRVGDQRPEGLDLQRRDRRLLRRLRHHRPREPPHQRLRRREGRATASTPASSSTSSGSRARRPARRPSPTSASRTRT